MRYKGQFLDILSFLVLNLKAKCFSKVNTVENIRVLVVVEFYSRRYKISLILSENEYTKVVCYRNLVSRLGTKTRVEFRHQYQSHNLFGRNRNCTFILLNHVGAPHRQKPLNRRKGFNILNNAAFTKIRAFVCGQVLSNSFYYYMS